MNTRDALNRAIARRAALLAQQADATLAHVEHVHAQRALLADQVEPSTPYERGHEKESDDEHERPMG